MKFGAKGQEARGWALAFACVCLSLVGLVALPTQAMGFTRGFTDDVWFTSSTPSVWLQKTEATRAKQVLLEVDWQTVEPKKPRPNLDPTDPNGPQFDFSYLDARLRIFAASGLSVALLVTDAPRWAEQPGGPPAMESTGGWRPDPTAFGHLGAALARRYSGGFPDPLHAGQALPRVRYLQAWAEPNLSVHLSPQWVRSNGQLVEQSPTIYRNLLNAFYAGVKGVMPSDQVLTSGFEGFGDPPSASNNARMPPVEFLRGLLCLNANLGVACHSQTHYDVLASDPYAVFSPTTHAVSPTDATAPDLGRLTRVQRAALNAGTLLPRTHKKLWVTEFSYDSKPANPYALSLAKQARWLEESFYVFWNEGVNTVIWYLVRDQAPTYHSNDYYSGVYLYSGKAKPSFTAYRFPFVVMPFGHAARVWGISPSAGSVSIQRKHGRRWRTLFRLHASAGGVFVRRISGGLHGNFRARIHRQTSLVWHR